jgi:hypothetical protein
MFFFSFSPGGGRRGGTKTLDLKLMRQVVYYCATAKASKNANMPRIVLVIDIFSVEQLDKINS